MPKPITADDIRASEWSTVHLRLQGGWQQRYVSRDFPVEIVVTGRRGSPSTRRFLVHGMDIGSTLAEAVAALNDWSIVQRALDAESAQNNVDRGDLHGRGRSAAARRNKRAAPFQGELFR